MSCCRSSVHGISDQGDTNTYHIPEHLDHNIGENKCLPHIGLGLSFARLVQSPLHDEIRHDLVEQLNALRHEDEILYNIVAIDVWALAKTMDEIHPGFWADFMRNREKALRQFMAEMSRKAKTGEPSRPPFLQ